MWFQDRVLSLKLICKVNHKIYFYKKQDHLGNQEKIRRATKKSEATRLTNEFLSYKFQRWNCKIHNDKRASQSWSRCSKIINIRNNFLKTWVKSKGSADSTRHHKNDSTTWIKQIFELYEKSDSTKHQCRDCNVLSEIISFVTVTGEIWITRRVLQYSRTSITTLLQSQTLSLRRISVEDQSTTHLKDRSCSTRRIWYLRKQDRINMTTIRQILSRWYARKGYRESLTEYTIDEKEVMLFDRIALERHDYTATRAERLQNVKHWIVRLNTDRSHERLRQRSEFVDTFKKDMKIQDVLLTET